MFKLLRMAGLALPVVMVGPFFTVAHAQEQQGQESAAPSAITVEDEQKLSARPIDELVTTARRTEENVLEVPIAITTFSEDQIDRAGIRSIADVAANTPGLSFANFFGQELPKPVIRGVAPLDILGGESNTAVYIDGVYISAETGINFGLLDVERIEVLKGPQGAYFGNNAFSGAINYVTLAPTDEFSSKVDLQAGDNGKALAKLTLAGPLIGDTLSGRASILYDDFDGTYKNASTTESQDIGGYQYKSIAGSLFWTPADNFSAQWSLYYSDDEIDPPAQSTTPANCEPSLDNGDLLNYCGDLPTVGKNDLLTIPGETGQTREVTRSILKLDWDVSFGTWSSLTGWSETKDQSFQNGNPGSGSNLFKYTDGTVLFPGPVPGTSVYRTAIFDAGGLLIPGVGDNKNSDFSQEFRFTSNQDQRARYTAGLYYFQRDEEDLVSSRDVEAQNLLPADFADFCPVCVSFGPGVDWNPANSFFGSFVFGPWFDNFAPFPGFPAVAPATAIGTTKTETRDYAAFGSIEYDVTDLLTAYAELRYTDREVKVSGEAVDPSLPNEASNDYWTWRASLSYEVTDLSNVYASVAQGEKGGGLDSFQIDGTGTGLDGSVVPVEFGNEKNITWELGYKAAFADGRIVADAAVYYIDWQEIVLRQFITEVPDPSNPGETLPIIPTAVNQNLGNADIKGLEFGVNAQITDHWFGGLGYSFNDAVLTEGSSDRYAEFPSFAPDGDVSGQDLPRQPESQFNANLTFRHALAGNWEWYTRGDAFYQSKWYVDLPNQAIVPARWRANLRLGFESDRYTIELWSTNITDDDTVDAAFRDVYFTNLTQDTQQNDFFPWRMSIANPQRRVIGLRAIARFGD